MSSSTKLSNSVKALCCLSESKKSLNSEEISNITGINASKIRRLLSLLCKNKLVKSSKGALGGFNLNKDFKKIHLQEIYCAIEDRKAFDLNSATKNSNNKFYDSEINKYFLSLFSDIQIEIEDKMKNISLSEILKTIKNNK